MLEEVCNHYSAMIRLGLENDKLGSLSDDSDRLRVRSPRFIYYPHIKSGKPMLYLATVCGLVSLLLLKKTSSGHGGHWMSKVKITLAKSVTQAFGRSLFSLIGSSIRLSSNFLFLASSTISSMRPFWGSLESLGTFE